MNANFPPRHLVAIRHGESEGDVRRANYKRGDATAYGRKLPADENETARGHLQSAAAGKWITKHILEAYGLSQFDKFLASSAKRVGQSADSLQLPQPWEVDERLNERDRGLVQGITPAEHKIKFPDSYKAMHEHPFHWVPPKGKSLLHVAHLASDLIESMTELQAVLLVGHRDWLWASSIPLDRMPIEDVVQRNTDEIENGMIYHYTNLNPKTNQPEQAEFMWRRSVCPWLDDDAVLAATDNWQRLPDPY